MQEESSSSSTSKQEGILLGEKISCKNCERDVGKTAQHPNGDLYAQFEAENVLFQYHGEPIPHKKDYSQYIEDHPELEQIPKQPPQEIGSSPSVLKEKKQIALQKTIPRGSNSTSNTSREYLKDLVESSPRNYQVEMYEKAMERDTICCLPTGMYLFIPTIYHLSYIIQNHLHISPYLLSFGITIWLR